MGIYDSISKDLLIANLEAVQGKNFNPQQRALMYDYTTPAISFSDPGTGKTYTVVNGLIVAELSDKIPGNEMVAVSFTRAASGELAQRHKKLCKKLMIPSTVKFKTFMGFCLEIIKDNYSKLGWIEFRSVSNEMTAEEVVQYFQNTSAHYGIMFDDKNILKTYNAIKRLNSSLVMDEKHVLNKIEFKRLGIPVAEFQFFRKAVYDLNRYSGAITVGDILLYTLELLLRFPEISKGLKSKIRVLLVDEFQDMSVLQLLLCSLISDNLIAIGDINQQIYSFNGACGIIVKKFFEFYPNAREIPLTKSYRCTQEICDFASMVVAPNGMTKDKFEGINTGGKVQVHKGIDIEQITSSIKVELDENNNVFQKDVMFLCRNNYSIIPMAESLFQKKVPFRIVAKNDYETGFPKANLMEVISDMCEVFEISRNPYSPSVVRVVKKFWPEFKNYAKYTDIPIARIMEEQGCSFLEACQAYDFKDKNVASIIINALTTIDDLFMDREPVRKMIDTIYPIMYEYYFKHRLIYMEQEPEYWINLVAPLLDKSYQKFIQEEGEKDKWVREWTDRRYGVRLYTMHSSKGLEADIVHIIDANEGVMPNAKKLRKTMEAKCYMDAADMVRNERSLGYVALTRARLEAHLYYDSELASIFTQVNKYAHIDKIYNNYVDTYDDVASFKEFVNADIKMFVDRV